MRSAFTTPYLVVYNALSCVGWTYLMAMTVKCFLNINASPDHLWLTVGNPLKIVQTAAALEIIHSITGVVQSPIGTTFLQVFSRIWVTWAVLDASAPAHQSFFCFLTVGSWCCVEIPRYLFYTLNQLDIVPYPIFWLRYSLFAVLYPTGITGELGCTYFTAAHLLGEQAMSGDPLYIRIHLLFVIFLALSYIPGAPTMYGHMVKTRKRQMAARNASQNSKLK